MLPENIIYITIFASFIGYSFYLKDILWGQTRPNLVSWFFWALAPLIGVFFQIKAGAGLSIIPVFLAGFGPLIVIIVSLLRRNSIWKVNNLDIICGIFAFITLILYLFTHNLNISILFAILTDALAGIPTIVKSWKFPKTETVALYLIGIFNNVVGLLIIKNWIFSIYSFSAYLIVLNIILVLCLVRKKLAISLF